MNIENYGFHFADIPKDGTQIPARITSVYRNRFAIICDIGVGLASLKASQYDLLTEPYPTTGDFVLIDWQENGESRIVKTLPRKTLFSRLDPSSSGHKEQAVAANFDYVFIMQSLDRNFNPRRLERYLTLSWQSGAVPVIVLTKADCAEDTLPYIAAAEKVGIGVAVIALSCKTGSGLQKLDKYLKPGKTIVLLGSSGVGKSTLINTLAGKPLMETAEVREKDNRGRHTTSRRQLILLKNGVMIIDTPGMRELGLWDADDGLEQSFNDVQEFIGHCKFSDCKHQGEPGCAIKQAIQCGKLSLERWESYCKLHIEAEYAGDKSGYLRAKEHRFKEISKMIRQKKKLDFQHTACMDSFSCKVCGASVHPEEAGSQHRNHCPYCLSSVHLDNRPGDRASICKGIMKPFAISVRKNGEWAIIHQCQACGTLHANRIAADDNATLLMSMAMRPLALPPFPLWQLGNIKE